MNLDDYFYDSDIDDLLTLSTNLSSSGWIAFS
jgi:hypothetical protein